MLAALATGNQQAFQEAKDEFNKNYELQVAAVTGQYQGNPTEAVNEFNKQLAQSASQFAQTFGLSQQTQQDQNAIAAGQLTGQYNGAPTLAAQNQAAQLSGQNVTPSSIAAFAAKDPQAAALLAANPSLGDPNYQNILMNTRGYIYYPGEQLGAPTEAKQEFNAGIGQSLLNSATQLRGPADYLQYQQLTHGGQNLIQQLYGSGQPGATAVPTGQLQSANINNALGDIGWNPAAQGIAVPQSLGQGQVATSPAPAAANTTSATYNPANAQLATPPQQNLTGGVAATSSNGAANSNMDPSMSVLLQSFGLSPQTQFNPSQIDPARWDALGTTGQALTKDLASTYFGYDPNDFQSMIDATRPKGTAPRSPTQAYAQPQGLF